MVPLGLLAIGEEGEITQVREGGHRGRHGCRWREQQDRIESLGIRAGKTVEMLNNGGSGPLVVRVGESRIAISRGVAMKIIVRRKIHDEPVDDQMR